MKLEDWKLVLRLVDHARKNYIESEKFLSQLEAHAKVKVQELEEVRPVLTRNPYTNEYSESAWEASDAYQGDAWRSSSV